MVKRILGAALLVGLGAVAALVLTHPTMMSERSVSTAKRDVYQCAMHPQIVSHEPGTCPICQMTLERVDEAHPREQTSNGAAKIAFYRHPMRPDVTSETPAKDEMGMDYVPVYEDEIGAKAGGVPGHAPFTLTAERQQLIGVTKERIERRALAIDIHAVGRVAYDPVLYQAIVEYREALRSRAGTKDSPWAEAREGSTSVVRSAVLKLRQQGLSDAQIAAFASDKSPPTNLLLPDETVWVYAQVYEYEAPLIAPGQAVEITVPSLPNRRYEAKVTALDSILNPASRTVRVRMLVPTPDKSLRPESFVKVVIHVPMGVALAVPKNAVLETGTSRIVFVVASGGSFEPRAVTLGRGAQEYYEVLAGLAEGDEVVTSANFLIDSESRFRAAIAAFKTNPRP